MREIKDKLTQNAEVCIIVPIYNAQLYLHRCVQSIQSQTFDDFQLVLVNDGSTDKSGEIADAMAKEDDRIHVIHKVNGGAASARNAGIDWAMEQKNCQWLCFADSDDWLHRRQLEYLYRACVSNCTDISVCMFSTEKNYVELPDETYSCKMLTPEGIMCDYAGISASVWGKLYKKELFKGIRYPEHLRISEDSATTYKILFQCKEVACIDSSLYHYFENQNSLTRTKPCLKDMLGTNAVLQQQVDFFKQNGYRRAYLYKKEILLASYAGMVRLGEENPFYNEHKRRFCCYAKELSEINQQSKWSYYNKYLGFRKCAAFEKVAVLFYRMMQHSKALGKRLLSFNRRHQ